MENSASSTVSLLSFIDLFFGVSSFTRSSMAEDDSGCAISAGDTAFMMFASTVVMMQTPAMGMAQAGMIRRKNALSMLMQVLFGMAIGSILWVLFGFSMAFGSSTGGVVGDISHHVNMRNVPMDSCLPDLAPTIPAPLFVAFHMMFALMAPLIVTGSWCEKMTFEAYLIFIVVWPVLCYYPAVHWIWNPNGFLAKRGALDFAGGIIIHTNTGIAGLVVSVMLQRRYLHKKALAHHNLPLSFIGATLVWGGWYSFNGGSALAANEQAAVALLNTHLSACTGAIAWSTWSFLLNPERKWSLLECISGAFAGLAGITPGSGFVSPDASLAIGLTTGSAGYWSVQFFKGHLGLDDVLDVTSLQGTAGFVGSLMVGLFAKESVGGVNGLFYGGGASLLGEQLLALFVMISWTGGCTFAILQLIKVTVGLDVSPEVETIGLDLAQIGEQAYDEKLDLAQDLGDDAVIGLLNEAAAEGNVDDLRVLITRHGGDPSKGDYDGRRPAHLAAAHGRTRVLEYLVRDHGIDINATDKFGGTPLGDAIRNKRATTAKWLRDHGAKADTPSIQREVFTLCHAGDHEELHRFVKAGVSMNFCDYDMRTPLMVACSEGHPGVVKELLTSDADMAVLDRWGKSAIDSALEANQHACVVLLNQFDKSQEVALFGESGRLLDLTSETTPLRTVIRGASVVMSGRGQSGITYAREMCTAASSNDVTELKRLIEKGADPNAGDYDRRTPLHVAAANGHLDTIKYLWSIDGIQVNAVDRFHQTPLAEAIRGGHLQAAAWMQEHGSVKIVKHVGSRLCAAAAEADMRYLTELQIAGSDLGAGDYDARTALHLAASEGHLHIVKYLLAHGVSRKMKDRFGNTALDDARRENQTEVVEFLEDLEREAAFT